jgi:ABC-type cobalamin/Fe3+-siderophores transport system ATPase subunit
MHDNLPFQVAEDFIIHTNRSVFLTGKAGTGKTTFLKKIKSVISKQTAVIAPTGVAAINAGGTTIHSFFQLPFHPFLPDPHPDNNYDFVNGRSDLIGRVKLNKQRREILQQLELLIIDEISMVRCDTLDAIDVLLRHFRSRPDDVFGGVQVLLIGDMFQLSPVAVAHEWSILAQHYKSPYFFHSKVMAQSNSVYIELDKIYRQSDTGFIKVLNEVRTNSLSAESLNLLQRRFIPDFVPTHKDRYITLCTHNRNADQINANQLALIQSKLFRFKALVKGEYAEKSYPADIDLQLKVGARVIFIKNDKDKVKRYYNGKIGLVKAIEEDIIQVICEGEKQPIFLKREIWENIRYEIHPVTRQVSEQVIGTFEQFPLSLAWAITIHKSQGLTFENVIIDAGKAFSPGQVYVALSRCTSLDGLVLLSSINKQSLRNDANIIHHSENQAALPTIIESLEIDKTEFKKQLLISLFDFNKQCIGAASSLAYIKENQNSFNDSALTFCEQITSDLKKLQEIAVKFQHQLEQLFCNADQFAGNLNSRFQAASAYFSTGLEKLLSYMEQSEVSSDNKIHAESHATQFNEIYSSLSLKLFLFRRLDPVFTADNYYRLKAQFVLPEFKVTAYAGEVSTDVPSKSPHPLLHQQLFALRRELCAGANIPVYLVAGTNTLLELSTYLPQSTEELQKIRGFGPAKIRKYGELFLTIIRKYCIQHNLNSEVHLIKHKKEVIKKQAAVKPDTKQVSFNLYKEGKSIREIAVERNVTLQTIFGHLAHFVILGEIPLNVLVDDNHIRAIITQLEQESKPTLSNLKLKLKDDIGYDEIRLVLDWLKSQN